MSTQGLSSIRTAIARACAIGVVCSGALALPAAASDERAHQPGSAELVGICYVPEGDDQLECVDLVPAATIDRTLIDAAFPHRPAEPINHSFVVVQCGDRGSTAVGLPSLGQPSSAKAGNGWSVASLAAAHYKKMRDACLGEKLAASLSGDKRADLLGSDPVPVTGVTGPSPSAVSSPAKGPVNPYAHWDDPPQAKAPAPKKPSAWENFKAWLKGESTTEPKTKEPEVSNWEKFKAWIKGESNTEPPNTDPKPTGKWEPPEFNEPDGDKPGPTGGNEVGAFDMQRFLWECAESGWQTGPCVAFVNMLNGCDATIAYVSDDAVPCGSTQKLTAEQVAALEKDCASVTKWGPGKDPCGQAATGEAGSRKQDDCVTKGQWDGGSDPCSGPHPVDVRDAPDDCLPPVPGVPPITCGAPPGPGPMPVELDALLKKIAGTSQLQLERDMSMTPGHGGMPPTGDRLPSSGGFPPH